LLFKGQLGKINFVKILFRFFLCLFFCLVAAKFILKVFAVDSRGYLLGLTALLAVNVYVIDLLTARVRRFSPAGPQAISSLPRTAGGEEPSATLPPSEV
jgi:Kef-type K+ transport system membrane component KefB